MCPECVRIWAEEREKAVSDNDLMQLDGDVERETICRYYYY